MEWATHRRRMAWLDSFVRHDGDALQPSADDDAMRLNAEVQALRSTLRALPEEPAPDEVWNEVERRLTRSTPRAANTNRRWIAYAVAATFAISIVGVLVMRPPSAPIATAPDGDSTIRELIAESQRLERDLAPYRSGPRFAVDPDGSRSVQWAASRDTLVYRLADIDDELTVQSLTPSANSERMAALWRQRVELMQSLAELERAQQWQAYRTVVF